MEPLNAVIVPLKTSNSTEVSYNRRMQTPDTDSEIEWMKDWLFLGSASEWVILAGKSRGLTELYWESNLGYSWRAPSSPLLQNELHGKHLGEQFPTS